MAYQPLADRMRPTDFSQIAGQQHLFGKNGAITRMLERGYMTNMIFYGPPGTGKTTAARLIAARSGMQLHHLNATSASLTDVKEVIASTNGIFAQNGVLLYLDEMQYFNKKQQQSLLEFIEDGRLTLITSTTENPYLYIYNAIISRSAVFEFHSVSAEDILPVIDRAIERLREDGDTGASFTDGAKKAIADAAAGDVRRALMLTENVWFSCEGQIDEEQVNSFTPKVIGNFDKSGTVHYDLLSCLQKSVRGSDPDAAVFYLCKALEGGDLPGVTRRLQVMASEDIGLAYPQAAAIVRACVESARDVGMPEAAIPLANATVLLATAPKSNTANCAYEAAQAAVGEGKGQNIPPYMRPSNNYAGYKYPHNFPNDWVAQQYLPDDLVNSVFYKYGANKTEQAARAYWDSIKNGNK